MKLIYVTNARIPTEKAHGLQIMKSCEAFVQKGIGVKLIVPHRINTPTVNPFEYYDIKQTFPLRKLFCVDLFWLPFLPREIVFYIQALSFGFLSAFYLLFRNRAGEVFYSRDYSTLFFLCVFGFFPIAEIHDYRSKDPKWVINYILKKSRKIVINSSGTLELIKNHYPEIPADKFLIVPNGVDLEFFDIKESREEARTKLRISQDKTVITYVGSIEAMGLGRGIEDLIRAFGLLSDLHDSALLYIIGGPDRLIEKYKKLANSESVVFTGRVDYKKISLYLRAIDIVVIPSPEGQHSITTSPIKLFEFLAAGKTIIASDLPSFRVYLNDKNSLFFRPKDPEDLAEKIRFAIDNPDIARRFAEQASKDSVQYSWQKRADKIIDFISKPAFCYFGDFDPEYARNRVIIKGLRQNGVRVKICNYRAGFFKKYIQLIKQHYLIRDQYNIMIVGYSDNRWMVPLAKLLSLKPFIWDAFYSLYDSWVFDRRLVSPNSLRARYYWFLDWFNCRLADKILLDTNEHVKYFSKTFQTEKRKFLKVLVGADDKNFCPSQEKKISPNFIVHFHGKFIPLQGAGHIIKAANILKNENIKFQIIGKGQDFEKVKRLASEFGLNNIIWIDKVSYEELPDYINRADVCLGVFGDTSKAQRVIPNKVYEAIAMKKAVISGDTPAIRELFTDRENILLCKVADPEDLAKKILELKRNPDLKNLIAQGSYELFKEFAIPQKIGEELLKNLSGSI